MQGGGTGQTGHGPSPSVARSTAFSLVAISGSGMQPFHLPIVFPEVFLRPRAGFDLMLGNPAPHADVPESCQHKAKNHPAHGPPHIVKMLVPDLVP